MENKFVTHGISTIARKKGYDKLHCSCGGYPECICDKETCLISWHDLIDWVFIREPNTDGIIEDKIGNTFIAIERLEFWYNHLKDCPLSYEFKGRLLEWFRENKYHLEIDWDNQKDIYEIAIKDSVVIPSFNFMEYNTYKEAEHQCILEIFKLINLK